MEGLIELDKLIVLIISESFSDTKQFNSIPRSLQAQVPQKFPLLNSSAIKILKKRLQEEPDSVAVLGSSEFNFKFDYSLLPDLCTQETWVQAGSYAFFVVCHAGLRLLLDFRSNIEATDPHLVIDSLEFVRSSLPNEKTGMKKRNIVMSLFYAIMSVVINLMPNEVILPCVESLCKMIIDTPDIPLPVLALLVDIARKMISVGHFDSSGALFVEKVSVLVQNWKLPDGLLRSLLWTLISHIKDLRVECLRLFSLAISVVDSDEYRECARKWPSVIADIVRDTPHIASFQLIEHEETKCCMECGSVLQSWADVSHAPSYPAVIEADKFIPQPVKRLMGILVCIFEQSDTLYQEFAFTAIEMIREMQNLEYAIEIVGCLIQFFVKPIARSGVVDIFTKWLFSPVVSVFSLVPGYDVVFSVRRMALSVLVRHSIDDFAAVFGKYETFPLTFVEFLLVLRSVILDSSAIIHTSIVGKWQDMSCLLTHAISSPERQVLPRLAVLLTLRALLVDEDVIEHVSETCLPVIFHLVYQNDTRAFILDIFSQSVAKKGSFPPASLSEVEEFFSNVMSGSLSIDDPIPVVYDIVSWLYRVSSSVKITGLQIDKILSWMATCERNDLLLPILDMLISLMVMSEDYQSVSVVVAATIDRVIEVLYHDIEPDAMLWVSFLSLLSGEKVVKPNENFLVTSYRILSVMMKRLQETKFLLPTIDLFVNLAQFSSRNCLFMHKANIDVLMVEYLRSHARSNEMNRSVIEKILMLLVQITNHCTSVLVVNKVASLFCPVDSSYLPIYQETLMEMFGEMIRSAAKRPAAPLPIQNETEVPIAGLTGKIFTDSFSISFWIMVTTPMDGTFPVVLIEDSDQSRLNIQVNDGEIQIFGEKNGSKWSGKVQQRLKADAWSLVTLTMITDKIVPKIEIFHSVNAGDQKKIIFKNLCFGEGPVNVVFGGGLSGSRVKSTAAAYFGPFGIFPRVEVADLLPLRELGPRAIPRHLDPLIFVMPSYYSDTVTIETTSRTGITAKLREVQVRIQPSFTDILINHWHIDLILPLFAQAGLKFRDGSTIPCFLDRVTELLEDLLFFGPEAQHDFALSGYGFVIISHLLKTAPRETITYCLFRKYLDVLSILTDRDAIEHCLEYIILNMTIWSLLDGPSHLRYLKDVLWVICPKYLDILMRCWPPVRIFCMMRIYYYYSSEKMESFAFKDRTSNFDVSECRKVLFRIVQILYRQKFRTKLVELITGSILTCPEPRQVQDHLEFIERILLDNEISESVSLSALIYLQQKFSCGDPVVVAKILILFSELHQRKRLTFLTFDEHVFILSRAFRTKRVVMDDVFPLLADICISSAPELFPFLVMIAHHGNERNLTAIMERVKRNYSVTTGPLWHFWLVVSLYECSRSNRNLILDYICGCEFQQWIRVFRTIVVIGKAINGDYEFVMHAFLVHLAGHLVRNCDAVSDVELKAFAKMATSHCLYRYGHPYTTLSETLSNPDQPQSRKLDSVRNMRQVLKRIRKINDSELKRQWRLRVSESGQWLDSDIAYSVLYLYDKFNPVLKGLQHDVIILMAYQQRFDTSITDLFERLRMGQHQGTPVVSIFNAQAFKLGRKVFTSSSPQTFLSSASAYLQTLSLSAGNVDEMNVFEYVEKLKRYDEFVLQKLQAVRENSAGGTMMQARFEYAMNSYLIYEAQSGSQAEKCWKYYWRRATVEQGTWHQALSLVERQSLTYTRDDVLCGNSLFPMKLKQTRIIGIGRQSSRHSPKKTRTLSTLFELTPIKEKDIIDPKKDLDSKIKQFRKEKNEIWESDCELITLNGEQQALMTVVSDSISIYVATTKSMKVIPTKSIRQIMLRTRFHRKSAIEIFDVNGKTRFVNFPGKDGLVVLRKIYDLTGCHIQRIGFRKHFEQVGYTEMWRKRDISNFDYLMMLNCYSGRSFRDIHQYPVMPWVLADYESKELCLSNPASFRDFRYPMNSSGNESKVYSAWMLCEEHVCEYLVRLNPFLDLCKRLNGGKINKSNIVMSLSETFTKVLSGGMDVRELTPEFFTSPEFLIDSNKVGLGDIKLPQWASSPIDFIYQHRKALESEFVSTNLPMWIDMVWGVDQHSQQRFNVYNDFLYPNVWDTHKNDEMASDIEMILSCNGQVPQKLFNTRHPSRSPLKNVSLPSEPDLWSLKSESQLVMVSLSGDKIHALHEDGRFELYDLRKRRKKMRLASPVHYERWVVPCDSITSCFSGGIMCAWLRSSNKIALYSPEGGSKSFAISNPITCLSCDDRFVVTADCDALLSIYDRRTREFCFTIPTFCKGIRCVCVSNKFHAIVCGTKDNTLLISSTTLKSVVKRVPLGDCRPEKVLITPSWGFIVVYLTRIENNGIEHQIGVYTINGDLIRKTRIEDALTLMNVWSSPASFDYVVISDVSNHVYMFEAFYASLVCIGEFKAEVFSVFHWDREDKIVALLRTGDVCMLSMAFPQGDED